MSKYMYSFEYLVTDSIVFPGETAQLVSIGLRIGTFLTLGGYLTWKRFAMRNSNVKTFVKIFILFESLKIIQENIIEHTK